MQRRESLGDCQALQVCVDRSGEHSVNMPVGSVDAPRDRVVAAVPR